MATLLETTFDTTTVINCPAGTTAQRPSPAVEGDFRYNTSINNFEVYNGSAWATFGGPTIDVNLGSSPHKPALSAKEAYQAGNTTSGYIWMRIGGTVALMEYDATDKFDTGEYGWVRLSNEFVGANYGTLDTTTYGSPSTIIPAWNVNSSSSTSDDTISSGQLRIGREQSHAGGNSLSTVRCSIPYFTSVYYDLNDAQSGGSQTADFGTSWQSGSFMTDIYNNSPYQNNGSGYWCIVHNGNTSLGNSAGLILDPGNLRSGNGTWTTENYETFESEISRDYTPYVIWGTTDAFNEFAYIRDYDLWFH